MARVSYSRRVRFASSNEHEHAKVLFRGAESQIVRLLDDQDAAVRPGGLAAVPKYASSRAHRSSHAGSS